MNTTPELEVREVDRARRQRAIVVIALAITAVAAVVITAMSLMYVSTRGQVASERRRADALQQAIDDSVEADDCNRIATAEHAQALTDNQLAQSRAFGATLRTVLGLELVDGRTPQDYLADLDRTEAAAAQAALDRTAAIAKCRERAEANLTTGG